MAGLSEEKLLELREALLTVDEHYTKRLNEIEREVRNLRERGSPIGELGENTTEEGTDTAVSIIESVSGVVVS